MIILLFVLFGVTYSENYFTIGNTTKNSTATPNYGWSTPFPTIPSNKSCPSGYTILNDQKCVKLVRTPMTFDNALDFCRWNLTAGSDAKGNLVSIQNAIDNRALVSLAASMGVTSPIWIGLNCSKTSNPWSCSWTDESGNASSYSNFANGNPFVDVGRNVYMLPTGTSAGKWVSGDGSLLSIDLFCEAPAISQPATNCSNPFNGYCYNIHLSPKVDSASSRTQCLSECGDIVSIHSQAENDHIISAISQLSLPNYNESYIRIGGFTDGFGKYWLDRSTWDFDNLGYFNSQIGSCMVMAIRDDIVPRSSWMSNNCAVPSGFICKRRFNSTC